MNNKVKVVFIVLTLCLVGVVITTQNTSDASQTYTARVFVGDGTVSGTTELSGNGTTVKGIVTSAAASGGYSLEVNSNGTIGKFGNISAGSNQTWVIFQWIPLKDWSIVRMNTTFDSEIEDGTSYYIFLSYTTEIGGVVHYSAPSYEPISTAYFFIKFVEDVNVSTVTNVLTESQRLTGFWVSGSGSDAAEAFYDACKTYGFELNMNLTEGSEVKGWLGSFLGLEDESLANGNWDNWSQFYWNGSTEAWTYGECLGHYDPGVTGYFCFVRQITESERATAGTTVTPLNSVDDIARISSGCTVTFIDGNDDVIDTQTVDYFGTATAPSTTPIKSSSGGITYVFTGWDKKFDQVITDITLTAQFVTLGSSEGITITSSESVMERGSSSSFKVAILSSGITENDIRWSSSDGSVVTVDSTGMVNAISIGQTTITVTTADGKYSYSVSVKVIDSLSVSSVVLDYSSVIMSLTDNVTLTSTVLPSTAKDGSVTWHSSDESVLTVDPEGNITVISSGSSTVTVTTTDGGYTADCIIMVVSSDENVNQCILTDIAGDSFTVKLLPSILSEHDSDYAVITDIGKMIISSSVLKHLYEEYQTVTVSISIYDGDGLSIAEAEIVGDKTVYELSVNDGNVSSLGGDVTVTLPYESAYGDDVSDLKVYSVDWKGNLEEYDCTYDPSSDTVTFVTDHFSLYFVSPSRGLSEDCQSGSFGILSYVCIGVVAMAAIICAVVLIHKKG